MLSLEEKYLDQVSEVFYSILKGKKPSAIRLSEDHPDNELKQAVGFINQFIDEYNGISELMYSLSRGDIHFEAPKGKLRVIHSLKSLQASLRNLTWTTQQIAKGEFDHRVSFMGEFSDAFNSMTQQLKLSFQEREKSAQALHDQVDELARARRAMLNIMEDLEEARKEPESATKAKSDFLANMSHEIRTPMNAVIGMAHLTLQTDLTPKQADYVKKIQRSADSLLGILNDILDFSKIEAGKMQMESVDFGLDEVLDNVSTVVGVLTQGAQLVIADSAAATDPRALARLLETSDATIMQATPSTWRMLFDSGWPGRARGVPGLVMSFEHFNRIMRSLEEKQLVELEINVAARFHGDAGMPANVLAEIPGTDRSGEIVLAGAHLDSWHGGTGATDNAAGVAVVMEAARILTALGVKPRRSIPFALWAGEEQGMAGSRAYVREHIAIRPEPQEEEFSAARTRAGSYWS